ncbi:ABC transporter permease [Glaciecola siphonariae]|uniref:ABC transporter permease n=1 Tax=Glaciecola siphonariae TaxID=521012 RepID=A0ABV9LXT5_9ALTE
MILSIALGSLRSRRSAVLLTLLSMLVSVSLLLSVEHIRSQAKQSFSRTVSDVDIIVGARTGQMNLLLYSIFRIGSPSNNLSWDSFEAVKNANNVAWAIPLSLGDSHRGYRVVGTNEDYFTYYKYGNKQALSFEDGNIFSSPLEAVIGAEVARKLNYEVGDSLVISHGIGHTSFHHHDDSPFTVAGILTPTGTPVDQTVHVSLAGIEAMHMSEADQEALLANLAAGETPEFNIQSVSAVLVGLESKIMALSALRDINQYRGEPLSAILPGIALAEVWKLVGNVENLLRLISFLILISSLLGMATMLLTSIRERSRELAVLRAIGASPIAIFILIQAEALLIALSACVLAMGLVYGSLILGSQWLSQQYGLFIEASLFNLNTLGILALVCVATLIIACIPAVGACKQALQQGLQVK